MDNTSQTSSLEAQASTTPTSTTPTSTTDNKIVTEPIKLPEIVNEQNKEDQWAFENCPTYVERCKVTTTENNLIIGRVYYNPPDTYPYTSTSRAGVLIGMVEVPGLTYGKTTYYILWRPNDIAEAIKSNGSEDQIYHTEPEIYELPRMKQLLYRETDNGWWFLNLALNNGITRMSDLKVYQEGVDKVKEKLFGMSGNRANKIIYKGGRKTRKIRKNKKNKQSKSKSRSRKYRKRYHR